MFIRGSTWLNHASLGQYAAEYIVSSFVALQMIAKDIFVGESVMNSN